MDREKLIVAILDELIPPSADGRIPSAGTLGVADFIAGATLYASDPVGTVSKITDAVMTRAPNFLALDQSTKVSLLKAVEQDHPDTFNTLVQLTYMGYYSRPDVRPLFGVGAHPVHPNGYAVAPESTEVMDALTAPVRARGQAFRDV